jgi:hypothetical protein
VATPPKRVVLVLPDFGLDDNQIQTLKKEFENLILGKLKDAGAAADTCVENHVVVVVP